MVRAGTGIEIITGRYGKGTPEQNKLVTRILGKSHAAERFEIYFHWYNLIHELGHAIMWFYVEPRPHPVDEEVLVNQFAVAYWKYHGETKKLEALEEILAYALRQYARPTDKHTSAIAYAKGKWSTEELFNFNNYGWFQRSCVADILKESVSLRAMLEKMGIANIVDQPQKMLRYELNTEMPMHVIKDAAAILRDWGVFLPDARITFDNDPNRHMCTIDE